MYLQYSNNIILKNKIKKKGKPEQKNKKEKKKCIRDLEEEQHSKI
jgi:hypothetical protein